MPKMFLSVTLEGLDVRIPYLVFLLSSRPDVIGIRMNACKADFEWCLPRKSPPRRKRYLTGLVPFGNLKRPCYLASCLLSLFLLPFWCYPHQPSRWKGTNYRAMFLLETVFNC